MSVLWLEKSLDIRGRPLQITCWACLWRPNVLDFLHRKPVEKCTKLIKRYSFAQKWNCFLPHFSQETAAVAFWKASSSSLAAQMSSEYVQYTCHTSGQLHSTTKNPIQDITHIKSININIALGSLLSRGEYGIHEYTEVKTVTIKIPQKNS